MPSPSIALRAFRLGVPFALLFVFFVCLGRWQWHRMHEKEALFAEFESGGLITLPLARIDHTQVSRYQHVIATGRYDSDHQVLLDNMTHEGRVGYRVLTPLVGTNESTILVDRGWAPGGATRDQLPDVSVGAELRGLSGRLDELPRAGIMLKSEDAGTGWPRVMSYPTRVELEKALGREILPNIILLDADQPEGFVREWHPSTFPPERHMGYAITWFALALTVFITYLIVLFRKRTS